MIVSITLKTLPAVAEHMSEELEAILVFLEKVLLKKSKLNFKDTWSFHVPI